MEQNIGRRANHRRVYASGKSRNQLAMVLYTSPSVRQRMGGKLLGMMEGRRVFGQQKPYNNWNVNVRQCCKIQCRGKRLHLLPRLDSPVRPGPKTGSSAFPSSPTSEKS